MLVIDKTQNFQRLIATAGENTSVSNPSYVIVLESSYSKEEFTISFPSNTSPFPARYDEFILPTTSFNGIGVGRYNYSIEEATDGVVAQGILLVTDNAPDEFESITPEASDDDFLVYNP